MLPVIGFMRRPLKVVTVPSDVVATMLSKSDMMGSASLVTFLTAKSISNVIEESAVVRNCAKGLYLKLIFAPDGILKTF